MSLEEDNLTESTEKRDTNDCNITIGLGAMLRILLTFITFWIILKYLNPPDLYIVLPIALTILDQTDNIPFRINSWYQKVTCTKQFEYQIMDKINDLASYLLAWWWFKLDRTFLVFCLWRALGVIGFGLTRQSFYLIPMMDLMKEYLVYRYFIPSGFYWLPLVIITKICFEAYFHTQINPTSY